MTYTANAYYMRDHEVSPVVIANTAELRTLIEAMLAQPEEAPVVVLYINERPLHEIGVPDHELRIGILPDRKLGSIRYVNQLDSCYAVGEASDAPIQYQYMGHEDLFPADSLVELDEVLAVAVDFLATGASQRPAGAKWAPWPKRL